LRRCLLLVASVMVIGGAMSGCGPVEYLSQVGSRAAGAVAAAREANAERYAPYELAAAEAYLAKAREEAGYAEYQNAIELGRKSEEHARKARALALQKRAAPAGSTGASDAGGALPGATRPGEDPS
jgi:hypothetical protein